jgi:hypothetical protein
MAITRPECVGERVFGERPVATLEYLRKVTGVTASFLDISKQITE